MLGGGLQVCGQGERENTTKNTVKWEKHGSGGAEKGIVARDSKAVGRWKSRAQVSSLVGEVTCGRHYMSRRRSVEEFER